MFKFHLITDTDSYSGVLEAKQKITSNKFYKLMESEFYGSSVSGIVIVLMCRDPDIIFKPRLRFSKKEKVLYMDIMLDYHKFVGMTHEQRVTALCEKLLQEMPPIVIKYKFDDFDLDKLESNLTTWFVEHGFINHF